MIGLDKMFEKVNTTTDEIDEIVDRFMANDRIKDFIMTNDLSTKDIISNINVLLSYEKDETVDDELNIESKAYPGFSPRLVLNDGVIEIKYKRLKTEGQKMKNLYMPKELIDAKLSDYSLISEERRHLYQYARTFINSFKDEKKLKGFYLGGAFRSGKTYLSAAIGNELASQGYDVIMAYYPELSSNLKNSIGDDDFKDLVNRLKTCDLLILDDFGAESLSPFIRDEVLGVVLNYRMIKSLPVIMTSNIPFGRLMDTALRRDGSEQEKIKAMRIYERMKELMNEYNLTTRYEELVKSRY
ncbi:MAG: ATP-binding protein [Gammaproteobacteria bacterium]|nr:ATP-binding protein [Gammaproteobacteria bacterium]